MRCAMPLSTLLSLSILGLVSVTFANDASAEVACIGHKLLPIPRPQSSCSDVKPRIYPSPDGALRALSAIASSVLGMAMPRALAVLRLTTNSNLVGCSTGMSAGFSPLRTRPT